MCVCILEWWYSASTQPVLVPGTFFSRRRRGCSSGGCASAGFVNCTCSTLTPTLTLTLILVRVSTRRCFLQGPCCSHGQVLKRAAIAIFSTHSYCTSTYLDIVVRFLFISSISIFFIYSCIFISAADPQHASLGQPLDRPGRQEDPQRQRGCGWKQAGKFQPGGRPRRGRRRWEGAQRHDFC